MPEKSALDIIKDNIESNELLSLVISVIAATLIFSYNWTSPIDTVSAIPLAFLAVSTAFLFHELAHRFVSRKLRCHAVYKVWPPGIIFSILLMLIGIKVIILGAVVIGVHRFGRWGMKSKRPSMREIGLIASSGPAINLVLAFVFNLLAGFAFADVFSYLASINLWIGLFNLVPVKPLDGSKIFFWNTTAWFMMVLFGIFLLFI